MKEGSCQHLAWKLNSAETRFCNTRMSWQICCHAQWQRVLWVWRLWGLLMQILGAPGSNPHCFQIFNLLSVWKAYIIEFGNAFCSCYLWSATECIHGWHSFVHRASLRSWVRCHSQCTEDKQCQKPAVLLLCGVKCDGAEAHKWLVHRALKHPKPVCGSSGGLSASESAAGTGFSETCWAGGLLWVAPWDQLQGTHSSFLLLSSCCYLHQLDNEENYSAT